VTLDLQQVLREIDDEVKARRASGDFPPGMERDLDLVFARFAPATVNRDDLDGLIEAADRAAFVDPDPPTASRIPAVSLLKRAERKLLGWFFRFLAQQITAFAGVLVQALRLVSRRLDALDAATLGASPSLLEPVRSPAPAFDVAGLLTGVTGRVLVAEAGDGSLLRQLDGHDAYGVEPRLAVAEAAGMQGLDVRADAVVEHLGAVEAGALGALVLTGIVDRSPLGVVLALLDRAAAAVAEGGRIVVVATEPSRWGVDNPVEADLAPGRPLHRDTWAHLLAQHGFGGVTVVDGDGCFAVSGQR
jgi:hypothetical protein